MNMRIAVSAMSALAALASTDAHAQEADSVQQVVPAEFVELLWGSGMLGGRPDLLVGRLPDDLAAALAPGPDVRIVGSIVSRLATIAAVAQPGDDDRVRDLWDQRLLAGGWRAGDRMQRARGGFEQETEARTGTLYCSPEGRALGFATRGHRGDSTLVVFTLSGTGNLGMQCGEDPSASGPPNGQSRHCQCCARRKARRSGGGGGYDEWDSHTELRTDMTPGALVGHYAAQFLEQGWQPVTQTLGGDVAIHVFRRTVESGGTWQAALYVTVLPDGRRDLYVRAKRMDQ